LSERVGCSETVKIPASFGPAYVMGTRIKYERHPDADTTRL
jgi:hypothetical protein